MIFQQLNAGGDRNFAYVIADEVSRDAALVDPGDRAGEILRDLGARGLRLAWLINTHGHADHTGGNDLVLSTTRAKLLRYDPIGGVGDGATVPVGSLTLEFLHTPGHADDHVCVRCGDKLLTGDLLFVGKVGGTATDDAARTEYESLQKILTLPDDTEVWPGHNYGIAPSSTIGHERRSNPFLLADSFDAFLALKRNWAAYKAEHGIA